MVTCLWPACYKFSAITMTPTRKGYSTVQLAGGRRTARLPAEQWRRWAFGASGTVMSMGGTYYI